jgi:hypothetical protein
VRGVDLESRTEFTVTNKDGSYQTTTIWGLKLENDKIGNKEILTDAIEEGFIEGPINGWSIQATPSTSKDDNGDWLISYQVFLAKKSTDNVPWFTFTASKSELVSSGTLVKKVNKDGVTTDYKLTGGIQTHETPVAFSIDDFGIDGGYAATGLFTSTAALKPYYQDDSDKDSFTIICVPGAAKLTNFLCVDEDGHGYVTGSIRFGPSSQKLAP